MKCCKLQRLLTVGLVAVALVAFSNRTAEAWWGCGGWGAGCGSGWGGVGGGYGWRGGYGWAGGPRIGDDYGWGGGCGANGYGWGSRWGCGAGLGWAWRRPCYSSHYSSYSCYPCSNAYLWYDDCGCGGVEVEPDDHDMGPPPPPEPEAAADATPVMSETSGLIALTVPGDAQVVINGHQTTSRGTYRRYYSENLVPGKVYPYEIVATRLVDGEPVKQRRMVYLKAGQRQRLAMKVEETETALASAR